MDLEEVRLRQNRREFASDTRKGISESRARYSQIALRSTLGRPGPGLMLSKDMKRLAAFWTEAKYGKMSIEGRDPINTQTPHYSEAGAIHDGKFLVTPGNAHIPSNLQVRQSNRLDYRYPTPQAFPKALRSFAVKLVVKQRPCFDQNVIRCHQGFTRPENRF